MQDSPMVARQHKVTEIFDKRLRFYQQRRECTQQSLFGKGEMLGRSLIAPPLHMSWPAV